MVIRHDLSRPVHEAAGGTREQRMERALWLIRALDTLGDFAKGPDVVRLAPKTRQQLEVALAEVSLTGNNVVITKADGSRFLRHLATPAKASECYVATAQDLRKARGFRHEQTGESLVW